MTRRLDHALGVLSALDSGRAAPRPARPTFEVARKQKGSQFGQCTCGAQVIWSNLPSGSRSPFDFNDEAGDLCLVDGTMVEWSEALGHKRRFSLHYRTCPERGPKPA